MRISDLAAHIGIPPSTVRYYERIGLLTTPDRTTSGYRDYGDGDVARLLFITRARKLGLSCEQIIDLLPIWDGTNCGAAHERVTQLIDDKKSEIAARIKELREFAKQLDEVHGLLQSSPPPQACRTDLSCCMPESEGQPVALSAPTRRSAHA